METATKLGFLFQEGDHKRPRQLTQYFVVRQAQRNPLLAAGIYRHLIRSAGADHAAELFWKLLQKSDIYLWYVLINERRNPKPLPG